MPIVYIKGEKFTLQWKLEWDCQLLAVALRFSFWHKRGREINWILAEKLGYLTGLPKISRKDLSRRVSSLIARRYNPYWKAKQTGHTDRNSAKRRKALFDTTVPEALKEKHGHKPRRKWLEGQDILLLELGQKYRKSEKTIDWQSLVSDKSCRNFFPDKSLPELRKHYWSVLRRKNKRAVKMRRKDALAYKKKNIDRYHQAQDRLRRKIKDSTNAFLLTKVPLR